MYLSLQHAARWCHALLPLIIPLLSIYPTPTAGANSKTLVHRLFTIADSCPVVDADFRYMQEMLKSNGKTWDNFHLAKTVKGANRPMEYAHLAAGLNSFDQYGRRSKYVTCPRATYSSKLHCSTAGEVLPS